MHRVIDVATRDWGYLPPDFDYDDQSRPDTRRDKVVALCTGSQGEPRAAMARIAADEHPDVDLDQATS